MLFEELLNRLRAILVLRVRNGELTERGIARRIGLSQAHMHNVLKGARILTPEVADSLLRELRLTVFDLIAQDLPAPRKGPTSEFDPRSASRGQSLPRTASR